MIGQIFDQLTVLSKIRERDNNHHVIKYWLVQCSCGSEPFEITGNSLREKKPRRCHPCLIKLINYCHTHGESGGNRLYGKKRPTPEYKVWKSIRSRCIYNWKQYKDYGGRGIRVCDRWFNSFENFLEDMGRKPSPQHTIDRKNNNGDYSPDNCYWATDAEQRRNKRTSIKIKIDGKILNLVDWLKELNIKKSFYDYRRHKCNKSISEALGLEEGTAIQVN